MMCDRLQRVFEYARNTWKNPPPCPINRDFQHAAVELYSDKPLWERAALSMAYAIRHAPVIITPDDGIIGRAYEVCFEPERKKDPELWDYLIQSPGYAIGEAVYPGYTQLARLHLVTQPVRGHITWDWPLMLRLGTEGMKQKYSDALERAADEEAEHFYRGVLTLMDALQDWNDLHVAKLEEMGMYKQAELCRRVPRYPVSNFREAIQAFFMQYLVVFFENPFGGNGPGQFDKLMWPYLKRDLEEGQITLEEARELIDELFIRMDERVSANDFWNEMIIAGGTHKDGSSAVSPLSTIMVESVIDLNITHPSVYMRVPADVDDDYLRLCARYIKHGHNRAQVYSDPNVMRALIQTNHVHPEDACEYGVGGCLEVGIQGMNSDLLQCDWSNIPKMLELAITGGIDLVAGERVEIADFTLPGLAAFDEFETFYHHVMQLIDRLFGISFEMIEKMSEHDEKYRPAFLISSMIDDCCERGRHMHAGGARYHDYSMTPLGMPNVADALYAIKYAVFDNMLCTSEQLMEALKADFVGYERLQRQLRAIPKYGQENEQADALAVRVVTDITRMMVDRHTRFGGIWRPMIITFIYAPMAAAELGATADGNPAHTYVAQALTPQSRSMTKGITVAMNSCLKMPFELFSGGAATMWDLDSEWANEEVIFWLLKTFLESGAQVFQGNTTDVNELIEAQRHPEDYGHLIVRVGGFSARFVGLSTELQNSVIQRRRHNK